MSWLGLEEIRSLAARICEDFAWHCPAEVLSSAPAQGVAKRLQEALSSVDANIMDFLAGNRTPGLVMKAVCANKVKWELIERGYAEAVVSKVTQKVVLGLVRPAQKV